MVKTLEICIARVEKWIVCSDISVNNGCQLATVKFEVPMKGLVVKVYKRNWRSQPLNGGVRSVRPHLDFLNVLP